MGKVNMYTKNGVTITPGVGPVVDFGRNSLDLREVEESMLDRLMTDPRTLGVINTQERKKVIAEAKAKALEAKAEERKRKRALMENASKTADKQGDKPKV